ncbi:MAG: Mrp/NBP35 family ATP-binding protein [Candidatus Electryoneaceae bacterium]|nr:Mrp/NBP35 family ATP-binding protein [Candidatus Electryoneaceae bacterium]
MQKKQDQNNNSDPSVLYKPISGEETQQIEENAVAMRMRKVKHIVIVLSGKGGVGKTTVSVNLAVSLALSGKQVGLLDIDIHGPSVPRMLDITKERVHVIGSSIETAHYGENLKVMSIGLMLNNQDSALVWRGPMKMKMITQFLGDVKWGALDYLIIDSPPGTGDEPLSIVELIPNIDGAVIVTTPQQISTSDVRKSINFCRKTKLNILGVVENMSGFICPDCGSRHDIFQSGGGKKMATDMDVPFLGTIPIEPAIVEACDNGEPYVKRYSNTATAQSFQEIVERMTSQMKHK